MSGDDPTGNPTDDEARLAALLAVLALVRADSEPARPGADGGPGSGRDDDGRGRTGGAALARWRAGRLAALRTRR